jgi:hypothetical protein
MRAPSPPFLEYGVSHYSPRNGTGHGAGSVATAVIMSVVLVPLAWLTLGLPPMPFSPLFSIVSGELFTHRVVPYESNIFHTITPFVIRNFFHYFAMIAAPTLLYLAGARWISDRSTTSGHRAFAVPAAAICACLLVLLTTPFFWLVQYTWSMGLTQARMLGLLCGIGSYGVILGFLWWCIGSKQFGMFASEFDAPT